MFGLLSVILVGIVMSSGNSTESPLREMLHRPVPGVAPSTLAEALTITASTGGSHFQKLPGKIPRFYFSPDFH